MSLPTWSSKLNNIIFAYMLLQQFNIWTHLLCVIFDQIENDLKHKAIVESVLKQKKKILVNANIVGNLYFVERFRLVVCPWGFRVTEKCTHCWTVSRLTLIQMSFQTFTLQNQFMLHSLILGHLCQSPLPADQSLLLPYFSPTNTHYSNLWLLTLTWKLNRYKTNSAVCHANKSHDVLTSHSPTGLTAHITNRTAIFLPPTINLKSTFPQKHLEALSSHELDEACRPFAGSLQGSDLITVLLWPAFPMPASDISRRFTDQTLCVLADMLKELDSYWQRCKHSWNAKVEKIPFWRRFQVVIMLNFVDFGIGSRNNKKLYWKK